MEATRSTDPVVDLDLALNHGLTEEEYGWIVDRLERTPTWVELGIYSVMWSEHCSYKNSIALLKKLPRSGDALLAEAGEENAGLVDIGDGLAVAFKIESHNHPSAVEPYQGAATGVGGIHRDIFTMGARPICRAQLAAVRLARERPACGISSTASCAASATTATRSACRRSPARSIFDPSYEGNPLVNAMSVGDGSRPGGRPRPRRKAPAMPVYHRRGIGHRPRRHPRRDVCLGGDLGGRAKPSAPACRSAILLPRSSYSKPRSKPSPPTWCRGRHPGHGRGGPDVFFV